MKLVELVDTSRRVTEVSGRLEKIGLLASLLARVPPEEIEIAVAYLSGSVRQSRIGVGNASGFDLRLQDRAQSLLLAHKRA